MQFPVYFPYILKGDGSHLNVLSLVEISLSSEVYQTHSKVSPPCLVSVNAN